MQDFSHFFFLLRTMHLDIFIYSWNFSLLHFGIKATWSQQLPASSCAHICSLSAYNNSWSLSVGTQSISAGWTSKWINETNTHSLFSTFLSAGEVYAINYNIKQDEKNYNKGNRNPMLGSNGCLKTLTGGILSPSGQKDNNLSSNLETRGLMGKLTGRGGKRTGPQRKRRKDKISGRWIQLAKWFTQVNCERSR